MDVTRELEQVLTELAVLHEGLLVCAHHKREAILKGDIVKMEEILKDETALMNQVAGFEDKRKGLVDQASQELAIKSTPVKLAMIIERLSGDAKTALETVHARLKNALNSLQYRTRQNAELLAASMEHVNHFLSMVREVAGGKQKSTYGPKGRNGGGQVKTFDHCV